MLGQAMGQGWVDRVFGEVALDPKIVVALIVFGQWAALALHLVGGLPGADDDFADPPHRLAVRRHHAEGAEIVQDVLGGDRLAPDAALGEGDILGDARVEVVAHHQHVEMLVDGVDRVGPRRVGRRRQHVREPAQFDDVGGVPAARALGVKGVDVAPLEGGDRVLDKPAFVERVAVDRNLDVKPFGDAEAGVDSGRRRPPILVQFQRDGAALDHLDQRLWLGRVALAEKPEIDRQPLSRLEDPREVPGTGRAGRRRGPGGGAGAAAQERRHAAVERVLDLLRRYQVDVAVDPARGDDLALAGDDFRPRPDDDVDPGLDVGIAGFADRRDAAAADADIGFDDPPMVEDDGVGDDRVDRALGARALRLPHPVADHLAAAELHLLAVDRAVFLDLDDEFGVGEAQPVADGRPEHRRIAGARERIGHRLQRTVDGAGKADDAARPGIGDKPHLARLPRLEAGRGSGRDVEAEAPRLFAIELQRTIGLVEMVVRADLDRPVAGIGDDQGHDRPADVHFDLAGGRKQLARDHRIGSCTVTSLVPSGKVASTWISRIISGTPSITWGRLKTVAPSRISSATVLPSRAPSSR